MTQRQRKLAGTVAMFVLIFVYAIAALAAGVALEIRESNRFVELLFYLVAGLLWVLPAGAIISWMARPDTPDKPRR